jgi:hypothetical protein
MTDRKKKRRYSDDNDTFHTNPLNPLNPFGPMIFESPYSDPSPSSTPDFGGGGGDFGGGGSSGDW